MGPPRREFNPRRTLAALVCLTLLVLLPHLREALSRGGHDYDLAGETMGTTYSIKVRAAPVRERAMRRLHEDVTGLLATINREMSTYDAASDISRFNRETNLIPVTVSPALVEVTAVALDLAQRSGGAFDPTVLPLVELWGFGAKLRTGHKPPDGEIAEARARVGHHLMEVVAPDQLRKRAPGVRLDLSALAKGYAVDRVAMYLHTNGCPNVFVEIGGEVMTHGESAPGQPWRVAVETPTLGAAVGGPEYRRVELRNRAIATSGDYRNFFEEDGHVYTHVFDPATGLPVTNGVASVSVLAPTCMLADAYATTLMVMGPERGLALLRQTPGLEALVVIRQRDGTYREAASDGFPP